MGQRRSGPVGLGYREPPVTLVMPALGGAAGAGGYGGGGLQPSRPLGLAGDSLRLNLLGLSQLPHPADFKLRSWLLLSSDPAFVAFKRRVLDGQIKRARGLGRAFIPSLPEGELDWVEHRQQMKKVAAAQCRALLAAARAALDGAGNKQSSVRALSGYRSVEKEQELW